MTGDDEEDWQPAPEATEKFNNSCMAIGRVASAWGAFEWSIDLTIWKLANLDQRLGACLTAQLVAVHGRMRALIALMAEREISAGLIKKMNILNSDAAEVVLHRNRIVHSPLAFALDQPEVVRFNVHADKKLKMDNDPFDFAYSTKTLQSISRLHKRFDDLAKEIKAQLASLPQTPETPP